MTVRRSHILSHGYILNSKLTSCCKTFVDLIGISYVGVLWYITLGPLFQTGIDTHIEQPRLKNVPDVFEVLHWE